MHQNKNKISGKEGIYTANTPKKRMDIRTILTIFSSSVVFILGGAKPVGSKSLPEEDLINTQKNSSIIFTQIKNPGSKKSRYVEEVNINGSSESMKQLNVILKDFSRTSGIARK